MNTQPDRAAITAAMIQAYDGVMDAAGCYVEAMVEARRAFRLLHKLQAQPLVGWNPALERVSNGGPRWPR